MAKRIIIFVFLAVFFGIFFSVSFFSNSAIFNILRPARQFPKKEACLHLYGNKQVSVNKTMVKIYYCQPRDKNEFGVENWQKALDEAMTEVSKFYQLQFNHNMKMDFKIYPQIIYLNHSTDYFAELVIQDFTEELAEPHSKSRSLEALTGEVGDKMKDDKEWKLSAKKADNSYNYSYAVNLFVLGLDINALQVKGIRILGMNDESNNSLIFSTGFVDDEFKDFYESIMAHEIGHGLGIPKFYSYSGDSVKSSGVMGGGLARKLKDNYLEDQIKEEMMNCKISSP